MSKLSLINFLESTDPAEHEDEKELLGIQIKGHYLARDSHIAAIQAGPSYEFDSQDSDPGLAHLPKDVAQHIKDKQNTAREALIAAHGAFHAAMIGHHVTAAMDKQKKLDSMGHTIIQENVTNRFTRRIKRRQTNLKNKNNSKRVVTRAWNKAYGSS